MYSGLLLGQGDVLTMLSSSMIYHVQWPIDGQGKHVVHGQFPRGIMCTVTIIGPGRRVQTAWQRLILQSIAMNIKTIFNF